MAHQRKILKNPVEEDEGKDQKEPTFCHLLTSKALLSNVSYGNVPFAGGRVVLPALCVESVLDLNTASPLTHLLSCLGSPGSGGVCRCASADVIGLEESCHIS